MTKKDEKKQNRKLPRQERSLVTVEAISEATCLVLDELGVSQFHLFSTTRVAIKAGVSIGTLYQYFPSKEALLAEAVDYRYRIDLRHAVDVLGRSTNLTAQMIIKNIVKEIGLKSFCAKKNLYHVLSVNAASIVRPETASEMREAGVRFIHEILENHKSDLKVSNTRYAAFFIIQTLLDMRRAMFVSRPEYIQDPEFIEMLSDFASAFL